MEPITFTPPLYKQRYQFVKSLVEKYKPKKVADLGCGECSLLWKLKFCSSIEVLAGVDISEDVMKEKMHTLSPLPCEYLQPSWRPLVVTLYQGSVAQKDPNLLGFDMITCIELIEHLETEELAAFPDVIFGFWAPVMAVISTPNSEFNSLLPGVKLFRHLDHKFEWSKEEFESWALKAAGCYGYTVEFTGVGKPPPGAESVGFCTQIGIFVRNYMETAETVKYKMTISHVYKTIFKAVYPSLQDEKYLQYAVVSEVLYQAHRIKSLWDSDHAKENGHNQATEEEKSCWPPGHCVKFLKKCDLRGHQERSQSRGTEPFMQDNAVCIPLEKLFSIPRVKQLCGTLETLIKMITGKVELSVDGSSVIVRIDEDGNG
ncbi:small RNA 2'-O-methyltransferase [Microcaecilia unicolor]|uniref:Small RNA 2'-O-methyltransferase n=1 Tax=Microcaecilia unicolor TaxID=1415580 RepID=A0A6P7YGE0_9AMPH|nr:small RNA 2'-O-methyltransferase [Microcaecilia unicolor]